VQPYRKGQPLFVTGEIARGMFVFKTGRGRVRRRDPLGQLAPTVEQGPGDFVAEVGQLSGRPALVDVHAEGDMEALLLPPENLRTVMIAEPTLADRIMCALILRRVALIETDAGGPVLIGPEESPDVVRPARLSTRNAYPCQVLDSTTDRDAADVVDKCAPNPMDLPLAVCPKGQSSTIDDIVIGSSGIAPSQRGHWTIGHSCYHHSQLFSAELSLNCALCHGSSKP
jgi:thioredoxin reductase (NADPH)